MTANAVLIVSQSFAYGGLETRTAGQCRVLKQLGVRTFIAANSPPDHVLQASGADGAFQIDFKLSATCQELLQTSDELIKIIEKHDIGVVDVHPHLSFVPAFIAAHQSQRPFVITLHAPQGVPAGNSAFDLILNRYVLPSAAKVFCVSEATSVMARIAAPAADIAVLPNGVDTNHFKAADPVAANARWTLISRLDAQKAVGIVHFLTAAKEIGLAQIDIVGDGPALPELEDLVNHRLAMHGVRFLGRTISAAKFQNARGIVGMGRVLLEGMAMNLPCIMLSSRGVIGLLDDTMLPDALWSNYSGRGHATIAPEQLAAQLERAERENFIRHRLRDWVLKYHCEEALWLRYWHTLQNLEFRANVSAQLFAELLRFHRTEPGPYWQAPKFINDVMRACDEPLRLADNFEDTLKSARKCVNLHQYSAAESLLEPLLSKMPLHAEANYLYGCVLKWSKKDLALAEEKFCVALEQGFDPYWVEMQRR